MSEEEEENEEELDAEGSESSSPEDQADGDSSGSDEQLPSQREDGETTFVEIPVNKYSDLQERARERDEYLDKLRRVSADYDNYQKRMKQKRREDREQAERKVIKNVIPVLDDFNQALPDEEEEDEDGVIQGFRLIYRKLLGVLEEHSVEQINESNVPFDPDQHEAASFIESEDADRKMVHEIIRQGYRIDEQVIRPARVVVAKPPESNKE